MARQAGVRYALTKPTAPLSGLGEPDQPGVLESIRDRFTDAGITLLGLEGDPFDMSRIKLGQPGREADLDRYTRLLENMAGCGLHTLCYNFMARLPGQLHDWSRTKIDYPTRGGALATAFKLADLPREDRSPGMLSAESLWQHYTTFIQHVMPVAERVGVRMAIHPDDPPIPTLNGCPRIFGRVEAFERGYQLAPSPSNGVTFCQANFSLMPGDVATHARTMADRIAFVHWRNVIGAADDFYETFHDEGDLDMAEMIRIYAELSFDGPIRMDHAPLMHGEPEPWMPGYGINGRLLGIVYLRGLLRGMRIEET